MTAHPRSEHVHIVLLGGFTVPVGEREVSEAAWPSRRAAELLQLLALSDRRRLHAGAGHRVAVTAPATRRWRGQPPESRASCAAGTRS